MWKNCLRMRPLFVWSLWDIRTEVKKVVYEGLHSLVILQHLCQIPILCFLAGNKCYSYRFQKNSLQSQDNAAIRHFGNHSKPIWEKWRQNIKKNVKRWDKYCLKDTGGGRDLLCSWPSFKCSVQTSTCTAFQETGESSQVITFKPIFV